MQAVGVVLAGGRSSRLGEDKAQCRLDGRSLAERAVDRLSPLVGEVVVADRGRGVVEGAASLPESSDAGPAGGILAARKARPGQSFLVLACDLPFVPRGLLERLVEGLTESDWVVPEGPWGLEPAVSAWGPRALKALARRVAAGRPALRGLSDEEGLVVDRVGPAELRTWGDPSRMFLNVNRPEDLQRARRITSSSLSGE